MRVRKALHFAIGLSGQKAQNKKSKLGLVAPEIQFSMILPNPSTGHLTEKLTKPVIAQI
jgi:hypothetical protein